MSRDKGIRIVIKGNRLPFFSIERAVLFDILPFSPYHGIEAVNAGWNFFVIA